jgi:hypothetical protein
VETRENMCGMSASRVGGIYMVAGDEI